MFALSSGMVTKKERRTRCCEQALTKVVRSFHGVCQHDRKSGSKTGAEIKAYARTKGSFLCEALLDDKSYRVCDGLLNRINNLGCGSTVGVSVAGPTTTASLPVVILPDSEPAKDESSSTSSIEPLELAIGPVDQQPESEPATEESTSTEPTNGDKEQDGRPIESEPQHETGHSNPETISEETTAVAETTASEQRKRKRMGSKKQKADPAKRPHSLVFYDMIMDKRKGFNKDYSSVCPREQRRRVAVVSSLIVAFSARKEDLASPESMNSNVTLANSTREMLKEVNLKLQKELGFNFSLLKLIYSDETNEEVPVTVAAEQTKALLTEKRSSTRRGCKAAKTLLGDTSRNGYERFRKDYISEKGKCNDDFPSFNTMTESRPAMVPFTLDSFHDEDTDLDEIWNSLWTTDNALYNVNTTEADVQTSTEPSDELVEVDLDENGHSYGAKISGNYGTYLDIMSNKLS